MSELMIFEFEGMDEAAYKKMNAELNLNPHTGEGEWPQGLLSHTASYRDNVFTVVEMWETAEDEERWINGTIMPVMQKLGVGGPPRRADRSTVVAHHSPRRTAVTH